MSTETSGDGLGSYSGRRDESVKDVTAQAAELRAFYKQLVKDNGTATTVVESKRLAILANVFPRFGATTVDDKQKVERALMYYFSAHGTSIDTEWEVYGMEYPICVLGKTVSPADVVLDIGLYRLKKFMGFYTRPTIEAIKSSPEFQQALSERVARLSLAPGQEHHAVDFLGKDGSLRGIEASIRVNAKETALAHRARNLVSLSHVRKLGGRQRTHDIRSQPQQAQEGGGGEPKSSTVII